jgi:Leucine-rich repeat (LRR) protein
MKNIYLVLISLFALQSYAQITAIPDPNFEQKLINLGYDNVIDGQVLTQNINEVTSLNVSGSNISSLQGIEDFVSLMILQCSGNFLTELHLETLPDLIDLQCGNNLLTSLDTSAQNLGILYCNNNTLTALTCGGVNTLNASYNQLTSLTLNNPYGVGVLNVERNQLTSLDTTGMQNLSYLICGQNQIGSLDLSSVPSLVLVNCRINQLTSLTLANPNNITNLSCSNNLLTTLDLTGNDYNFMNCTSNPGLQCIKVTDPDTAGNGASWFKDASASYGTSAVMVTYYQDADGDGFGNIAVTELACAQPIGYVVDNTDCDDAYAFIHEDCTYTIIPDNNFEQKLINLGYDNIIDGQVLTQNINEVTSLNVSGSNIASLQGIEDFVSLMILQCSGNFLTELHLETLPDLIDLQCANNLLTSLDTSAQNLGILYCNNNALTALTCGGVNTLNASYNQLTSLTLNNPYGVGVLNVERNQLTSLDTTGMQNLSYLICGQNQIGSLDLSPVPSLVLVNCRINQLTSLTLANPNNITNLSCSNNLLTTLDLTGNDYNFMNCTSNPGLQCIKVTDPDTAGNGASWFKDASASYGTSAVMVTYYQDADGDGFGNIAVTEISCTQPVGYVSNSEDCDDTAIVYTDVDADGFGSDTFAACNGVANSDDCDDNTVNYADSDGDTYGSLITVACGGVNNNADCNDANSAVHPGGEIGYNLADDDCDGLIDEGFVPKATAIQTAMCNTVLAAIDSQIIAGIVSGAQGYRWRITTMSGVNAGQVQFINTSLRTMKLTSLTTYAFNTQYKVEVAVYYAGFLQPFTTSDCTVTTPVVTAQLSRCGQTLTSISDVIYAGIVPFATGYKFRVTDALNPVNTQELIRPIREFRMGMITSFAVQYGKSYNVAVSIKNTDGTWLEYGSTCAVTTPPFPTTSLQTSQCDNYLVPTNATQIYATSYTGAISYVFQLSGGGLPDPVEVIKNLRTFTLNDFAGQLTPGATYNARVRLIFNLADLPGPFGKVCVITTPGLARHIAVNADAEFNAVAYPNPFAESFNIDVQTASSEIIIIKTYDMVGRLLETRQLDAADQTDQIGSHFPSGVYNLVVTQGDHAKTLRVVKR